MNATIDIRCRKCGGFLQWVMESHEGPCCKEIIYRSALRLFDTFCTILVVHLSVRKSDVTMVSRLSPTGSIVQRCNSFHFTFHGLLMSCDVAPVIT